MNIEYKSSVYVAAGWRSVTITATAEKISEKRAKVTDVVAIDGEPVRSTMSRTGAKRQSYHGTGIAERERGKIKILSRCDVLAKK